jgi:hypothetical protein
MAAVASLVGLRGAWVSVTIDPDQCADTQMQTGKRAAVIFSCPIEEENVKERSAVSG